MVTLFMNNVVTGESQPLKVGGATAEEHLAKALEMAGTETSPQQIIISECPFESQPEVAADPALPTPAIPKPSSPTSLPGEYSDSLVVSTNLASGLSVLVNDKVWAPLSGLPFPPVPAFPNPVYAQLSTQWKQVGSAILTGPQTYSKEVSYTTGMSTTDSTTLSGEFGVSYKGLSAKLSATIGYSVTTSEETTISDTYSIDVPAGETVVYILWQLLGTIVFLGPDKKPIEWSGVEYLGAGKLSLSFPNSGRISQINSVYSDQTSFKS